MGFNTTIVIYNDALNSIKEDKNFGATLYDAIMENWRTKQNETFFTSFGHGSQTAGQVIEQHHSSSEVLVEMGGNTGKIKKRSVKN